MASASPEKSFTHSTDATVTIQSSVFGIASVELNMLETPIHGTGSLAIVAEGHYEGKISYNSMEELSDKKYQIECSMESGRLEITFRQPPDQTARIVFHGSQCQTQTGRYRGIFHFN